MQCGCRGMSKIYGDLCPFYHNPSNDTDHLVVQGLQ